MIMLQLLDEWRDVVVVEQAQKCMLHNTAYDCHHGAAYSRTRRRSTQLLANGSLSLRAILVCCGVY